MKLNVNGRDVVVTAPPDTPVLFVLRNDLGLVGAKLGCGGEQCGACRVLVEGEARYACATEVGSLEGKRLVTVEGLRRGDTLHPVQQALLDHNAAQCGICLSGIVIAAVALFDRTPRPSRAEIREALSPQLCRCGAHPRVLRALEALAGA